MRKELIAQKDPKSPISEVFRTLRTNIQFMNTNNKLKTLLVTSTFPGEGKSWTASNLAVTFAQAGKKVILIDADMRKGRQYAIFGVSPRPGLSNYLSGIDANENESDEDIANYIQKTEVENLLLISAGNIPPNPSELLVSARMINLLDKLKEVCDIIIIDGTPCELVTDSVILARIVDSTVIVTAVKETKKDALERVIKNIQNVGGKLAGVVLNKVPVSAKKYSETYYYASTDPNKNRRNNGMSINKNIDRSKIREEKIEKSNIYRSLDYMKNTKKLDGMEYNKENSTDKKDSKELEIPDILKRNINYNNTNTANNMDNTNNVGNISKMSGGIDLNQTQQILDQINSYLDQEKKNLN